MRLIDEFDVAGPVEALQVPVETKAGVGFVKSPSGGQKDDFGKARWDLVDYEFLEELVEVLTDGGRKYGEYNWQNLERWRIEAALGRHIKALMAGEARALDTGNHHAAHAAANLMFLYWMDGQEVETDVEA